MRFRALTMGLICSLSAIIGADAQECLVANPSFEVGLGLDGWNTFGDVGLTDTLRVHGQRSLSVGGPGTGSWGVSGAWQRFDASQGTIVDVVVRVGHNDALAITHEARGIVNVEWRDASDELISYQSVDVLEASDVPGAMRTHRLTSGPAPAGTASGRVLLGVLQSPFQEPGRVVFDLVDYVVRTTPTYDELQWGDFPSGRMVSFAGHDWRVKGPGVYGPGPNFFSDSTDVVDVENDELIVSQINLNGTWSSAEVVLTEPLGYGDYVFTTRGRLDNFAPNIILGLFLWQYPLCYDVRNTWNQHNEIDVEISRWADPTNDVAQFVIQPYDTDGNIDRFDIAYSDDELVSYAFEWLPDRIEFRSWRGGPADESPSTLIHDWTYTGQHLPRPEQPRVHVNLWYVGSDGPSDGVPRMVVVSDFEFRPMTDFDRSGLIDFIDLLAFLRAFDEGDLTADIDGDTALSPNDVALFVESIVGAYRSVTSAP